MQLVIKQLRRDERCQSRAAMDADHAAEIGEYLKAGGQVPPIVVFRDQARTHWVADGAHRIEGHTLAGRKAVEADVREGELRDAILFAAGANKKHGLRRSHMDKRRAVLFVLTDEEWGRWPNLKIAKHCGVSDSLVAGLREEMDRMLSTLEKSDKRDSTIKTNNGHAVSEKQAVGIIETLSESPHRRGQDFRDLGDDGQAGAVADETARHRPGWGRELRRFLEEAEMCGAWLGESHALTLALTRPALAALKAAEKREEAAALLAAGDTGKRYRAALRSSAAATREALRLAREALVELEAAAKLGWAGE